MILVPSFGKASPVEGAFLFARYLHEHGKDVVFVSLDENYNSKKNIIDSIIRSGIDYECLNIKGWWGFLWYRSYFQTYCREKRVNVALAYELRPTLFVSFLSEIVRIASVREMFRKVYPIFYPYGKFVSNIFASIQMWSLSRMDHVFTMSKAMSEWLISEGIESNKISRVNNFVDVRLISSCIEHVEPNNKGFINVGMFCIINPLKRIDVALRAFGKVIHDYHLNNVRLHIIGPGTLLDSMRKLSNELNLNNRVVFHGFVERPFPLMEKMDIILLTSESEGVPRCIMEALAMGKTVIASDIPGVNELVFERQTGYLFPPGDFDRLAYIIYKVVENKHYLPSRRLIDFMFENYDISVCSEKMLRQIEKVYSGIMTLRV